MSAFVLAQAEAGDRAAIARIWRESFPDGEGYWDWFCTQVLPEGEALVRREDGEAVCVLTALPCTFEGGLRAQYLYAVATARTHRGAGRMTALLDWAEERARARGLDLSVLLTEEDGLQDYYARFGFAPVCFEGRRPLPARPLQGRVRPMRGDDLPAVLALYREACAQSGLCGQTRDARHLLRQLSLYGEGGAAVADCGGTVRGYCFFGDGLVDEAVGPEGGALARACAPQAPCWRTVPARGETRHAIGCAKGLSPRGEAALACGGLYLNLMYN